MLQIDPGKLFDNFKRAMSEEYQPPYKQIENHETYRQIILMIENQDIDFNKFTEEDILGLLEIYYREEEDELEHGIAETAFLIEKFKKMPPQKDTGNVFV